MNLSDCWLFAKTEFEVEVNVCNCENRRPLLYLTVTDGFVFVAEGKLAAILRLNVYNCRLKRLVN